MMLNIFYINILCFFVSRNYKIDRFFKTNRKFTAAERTCLRLTTRILSQVCLQSSVFVSLSRSAIL